MSTTWSVTSSVARVFPGGPEDQNKEENEEILRTNKLEKLQGKWGKFEEMSLSCPIGSERLATALSVAVDLLSVILFLLALAGC